MGEFREFTKSLLQQVISGNKESISIPLQSLNEIDEILEELGFKTDLGGEETNGWQVDYWYTYSNDKQESYVVSGSLWYGENITFSKKGC